MQQVFPFEREAELELEGISAADFCDFWSSIAFSSGGKLEVRDAQVR